MNPPYIVALLAVDPLTDACVFTIDDDPLVNRQRIMEFKDRMLAMESGQIEMDVEHIVLDGMYLRKLFIPKGTVLVGKIHKKSCINIVAAGDISVMTESGAKRVQAGYTLVSPAGIMKVGYAHADTVFINVFRTEETDIARIEADIACESFADLLAIDNKEALCQ